MARIPYYDIAQAGPRARPILEKLPPWNVFKMAAHLGELFEGWAKFGNQLLNYNQLDPVLREIAVIRAGVLSKGAYEVFQHERLARQIGMSDALIAAIHEGPDAAAFDDLQRMVMRFTDEVVLHTRPSDATFKPLEARLGHQQLVQLVVIIGHYMAVSRLVAAFDVEFDVD